MLFIRTKHVILGGNPLYQAEKGHLRTVHHNQSFILICEMLNPDLSVEAVCALRDHVKFKRHTDTLLHYITCG